MPRNVPCANQPKEQRDNRNVYQTLIDAVPSWPHHLHPHRPKEFYKGGCPLPNCADQYDGPRGAHQGSFSINQEGSKFFCFSCRRGGGAAAMRSFLGNTDFVPQYIDKPSRPPKARSPAQLQGATLAQLCQAKGLDLAWCRDNLGWRDGFWYRTRSVEMPYYNQQGDEVRVRYRVGITGDRFRAQGPQILYGLWRLADIHQLGAVILVEGETDLATLMYHGYPVLAVPGAANWKDEWREHLTGLKVFIWREPGSAGHFFLETLARSLGQVWVIRGAAGAKDPNELHQALSADAFKHRLDSLMTSAMSRRGSLPSAPTAGHDHRPRRITSWEVRV